MNDTRIGRFFATDPLMHEYTYNSPYAFSENRVIDAIELEGLEKVVVHKLDKSGKWQVIHTYTDYDLNVNINKYYYTNQNGGVTTTVVKNWDGNNRLAFQGKPTNAEIGHSANTSGTYHANLTRKTAKALANLQRANGNEKTAIATEISGGVAAAVNSRVEGLVVGVFNLITSPYETAMLSRNSAYKEGQRLAGIAKQNDLGAFDAFALDLFMRNTEAYRTGDILGISEDISGTIIDYGVPALPFLGKSGLMKSAAGGGIQVTESSIAGALEGSTMKTIQGEVSLPIVQRYVKKLESGSPSPSIKVADGVIIDGNHRYVSGRLFGTEPPIVPSTLPPSQTTRVVPIQNTKVSPLDWDKK